MKPRPTSHDAPSFGERARQKVGRLAFEGFFEGAARLGRLHPRARFDRHGVTILRDVPYRGGGAREHLADVYLPPANARAGGEPPPLLLYVHGGAFAILSKDTHWLMGLTFARRGYVVVNVSYRLAPLHPFPAAVEDVCDAYVFAVESARRFGAAAGRIVVAGESAGANLAATLAVATCFRRDEPHARRVFDTGMVPEAVLPYCGIFQVTDADRLVRRKPRLNRWIAERIRDVETAYLGRAAEGVSRDLADPLVVFEREEAPARPLPPFFLPVGTKDPLLDDNRRLARALRGRGVVVDERYYPGELHAFHAMTFRPQARACWDDTFRFLEAHAPVPRA